jgi:hypothetical protein
MHEGWSESLLASCLSSGVVFGLVVRHWTCKTLIRETCTRPRAVPQPVRCYLELTCPGVQLSQTVVTSLLLLDSFQSHVFCQIFNDQSQLEIGPSPTRRRGDSSNLSYIL